MREIIPKIADRLARLGAHASIGQLCFMISPRLHRWAMLKGWIVEDKWKRLPKEKWGKYLVEDTTDREWFVEWVASQSPCSVLEVGAGAMHEVRMLRDRGALENIKYTVLDVAKNFLMEAAKEFPEVSFVEGSVNGMRFDDDSFDIVCCKSVLEHLPYYDRAVTEMIRVARHLAVFNLFRWSLHHDVIRRQKYYSNSYYIHDFLNYVAGKCAGCGHYLLLKGEELGPNQYEDDRIIRTGDHLVVIAAKNSVNSLQTVVYVLDRLQLKYLPEPYKTAT